MPNERIKAVFDCNVFWQIFFSTRGIARSCWDLVINGRVELFVSRAVLDEVQDVLTRLETRERFPQSTDERVAAFLDEILEYATLIHPVKNSFQYARDPKDEPYINLAVEAEADYIVTRDKDLLDLMSAFDAESKQFRQRFRPLAIIESKTLLEIVKAAKMEN